MIDAQSNDWWMTEGGQWVKNGVVQTRKDLCELPRETQILLWKIMTTKAVYVPPANPYNQGLRAGLELAARICETRAIVSPNTDAYAEADACARQIREQYGE